LLKYIPFCVPLTSSGLSQEAFVSFMSHDWPETMGWRETAAACLPPELTGAADVEPASQRPLKREVAEREREIIINASIQTKGNKRRGASFLGVPRPSLYKKMHLFGIAVS